MAISLRKGLVIFQYGLSTALIIGSIAAYQQLNFLRNKKLGASVEQTILIPATNAIREQIDPFKTELLKYQGVKAVSIGNRRMGRDINSGSFYEIENNGVKSEARLSNIFVDHDFLNQLEVELVAGRHFSKDYASDTSGAVILNESALRALDIQDSEDALNKEVTAWFTGTVVGVVKDFHFESVHNKIKPMIFVLSPGSASWISVKIDSENADRSLQYLKEQWSVFEPNREFRYSFLEDDLYQLYIGEERFSKVFTLFVCLAIFVACLGLFGLVTYSVSQRKREIGVRKVFGASVSNVTFYLIKQFLLLILVANVVAWPMAYFGMEKWLVNFEYRIDIPWYGFLIATGISLIISVITISFQSIRAASVNPIQSLKEE